MLLSPVLLNIERVVVVFLTVVAFLLAIVSFRGLVPVPDPITPIGYVDRLSLLFGLHEQNHVIIISAQTWSTDLHIFTFQKRLKDGAFYLTEEYRESLPFSMTDQISEQSINGKCRKIISDCTANLPFTASSHKTPVLFGLPNLSHLQFEEKRTLVSGIHQCLDNSLLDYSKEGSIGLILPDQQQTMQWLAVALLNGRLPYLKPSETPVIMETSDEDLLLTFAATDVTRILNSTIVRLKKVEVFGDQWDLVTVRIPDLGVYEARQLVLSNNVTKRDQLAASPCVNPVVDRWWEWGGQKFHVKGLHKSVEEVKERNGPFAGKRVQRPVADYLACHNIVLNNVQKIIESKFEAVIREVNKRQVYMIGKVFIKCAERGLTDPFKGGNVKMKAFMDSLKHACKVPNTDQPFACLDMMVVAVILDKVLGLHQSSILLTPHQVGGMTGDWPVTAAFQIYQTGI